MRHRFSGFVLDTDRFELLLDGQALKLEPQVIELLTLLVENRHRLVSKQEILQTIWSGKVVSEAALSSRVKTLRQVLGDSGKKTDVYPHRSRQGPSLCCGGCRRQR